jgi:hypothetical protein
MADDPVQLGGEFPDLCVARKQFLLVWGIAEFTEVAVAVDIAGDSGFDLDDPQMAGIAG